MRLPGGFRRRLPRFSEMPRDAQYELDVVSHVTRAIREPLVARPDVHLLNQQFRRRGKID
jgi:hypothetical protein